MYRSIFFPLKLTPFPFFIKRFYSTSSPGPIKKRGGGKGKKKSYLFKPIRITSFVSLTQPFFFNLFILLIQNTQPLPSCERGLSVRAKCNRPFDAVWVVLFNIGLPGFFGNVAWELGYFGKFDCPRRRPRTSVYLVDCRIEHRYWYL